MNFIKSNWNEQDIKEYNEYLMSIKAEDKKCSWEKKITCTNLDCLGIPAPTVRDIVKQISER